jgi:hypothetical protein
MSQSLLAFDTDHIKGYVFGTNKLKEIRGASSILDRLNRVKTGEIVKAMDAGAKIIYAYGGSALFVVNVDANEAAQIGRRVQRLYHEETGGGASITYAVQPVPDTYTPQSIVTEDTRELRKLLGWQLRLAKDGRQADHSRDETQQKQTIEGANIMALPSHPFLCTCHSCGTNYAVDILHDPDDNDEPGNRYCQVCEKKRYEDRRVKRSMEEGNVSEASLWGHILNVLRRKDATLAAASKIPARPKDFNIFREFMQGKDYLGLIYADANGMGEAFAELKTLEEVKKKAKLIDKAVFEAMGDAIRAHLPAQNDKFPFDILLIGGDDIVMVIPANKALQVAYTLAEQFYEHTNHQHTLSIGIVLAPIKYPFAQQYGMVVDALKAAKKAGAKIAIAQYKSNGNSKNNSQKDSGQKEQTYINFVVVTGNTSLSYKKVYDEMYQKKLLSNGQEEFYATLRPYSLSQLHWLLAQLENGHSKRLGRTKLHQLRQAILLRNNTTSILQALALLRNWKKEEREFMKGMVRELETRQNQHANTKHKDMGPLFPWYLDGKASDEQHTIYRTPLLDFVELYDFVSF